MHKTSQAFSNLQIELLKLYSNDLPDDQLHEIKIILGKYFAEKASQAMDQTWKNKNLSEQDMINWSNEHNRR